MSSLPLEAYIVIISDLSKSVFVKQSQVNHTKLPFSEDIQVLS